MLSKDAIRLCSYFRTSQESCAVRELSRIVVGYLYLVFKEPTLAKGPRPLTLFLDPYRVKNFFGRWPSDFRAASTLQIKASTFRFGGEFRGAIRTIALRRLERSLAALAAGGES